MTEQEERARLAMATLELEEAQKRRNSRLEVAGEFGDELIGLGQLLKTNPANIDIDACESVINMSRLRGVVGDVKKAEDEQVTALDRKSNLPS